MKIVQVAVASRRARAKLEATDSLLADYIERAGRYVPCAAQVFETEAGLLEWIERGGGRGGGRLPTYAVLLDSLGKQYGSGEFAEWLGNLRDSGVQQVVFAVGPADGWSGAARERANWLMSLGRMTLPHQLARVVLAEQVYRALTILAGHPYHSGH